MRMIYFKYGKILQKAYYASPFSVLFSGILITIRQSRIFIYIYFHELGLRNYEGESDFKIILCFCINNIQRFRKVSASGKSHCKFYI